MIKGKKKMKHRRREPGSGVSSLRSKKSHAKQARIPKVPNFLALRNQHSTVQAQCQCELAIPESSACTSALQQIAPAQQLLLRRTNDLLIETAVVPRIRVSIIPCSTQRLQRRQNVHAGQFISMKFISG